MYPNSLRFTFSNEQFLSFTNIIQLWQLTMYNIQVHVPYEKQQYIKKWIIILLPTLNSISPSPHPCPQLTHTHTCAHTHTHTVRGWVVHADCVLSSLKLIWTSIASSDILLIYHCIINTFVAAPGVLHAGDISFSVPASSLAWGSYDQSLQSQRVHRGVVVEGCSGGLFSGEDALSA